METTAPDWYERRHELEAGMIFLSAYGVVKLDGRVPGDGTKWYVADWYGDSWFYSDSTIEPGDLKGDPIADDRAAIANAVAAQGA